MTSANPAPARQPGEQLWLRSPWPLFCGLCVFAAAWVLIFGTPLESLEMRWFGQVLHWRYQHGQAPAADSGIVHVDVTRSDLGKLPTLELEYRNAANIIRQTTGLGARVVAFDVVFARGDQAMAAPILEEIERAKGESRTVLFAEAMLPSPGSGEEERIRSFPFHERLLPAGSINVQADNDGVFRHYQYAEGEPSLALASYLAWKEVDWKTGVTSPRPNILRWEEISSDFTSVEPRELRLDPILLNYRSPWSGSGPATFRHYTVEQLNALYESSRQSNAQPLSNAIVLVAYQGAGFGDVGTTSLAPNQPRVLLHSTALNDLIQRNWIRRSPRWVDAAAILSLLLLGLVAFFCRGTLLLLLLWVAGLALAGLFSGFFIIKTGWVPGLVSAGAVWTLGSFIELGRRQSFEFIQRLKLRSTMSLYFSPHIMEHVLKNPGSMDPQEAEITVLLTDVRNSTPIAEALGPAGMFALLNQIFEAQTRAILAEDGSMEHFLGDQFLSYWGAPDRQPDAADRAFRAALGLIEAMEATRPNLDPKVATLFGYGVALHSGSALIGNKGSAQRLDYGLVGDLINAAARVESLTKHYGVLFLITRETYARLSAPPLTRRIDRAVAKGTSLPLELLEVKHSLNAAAFEAVAERYNEAFTDYECGDFLAAERKFDALHDEMKDKPSALLAERCRELITSPPKDWKGVYALKSK